MTRVYRVQASYKTLKRLLWYSVPKEDLLDVLKKLQLRALTIALPALFVSVTSLAQAPATSVGQPSIVSSAKIAIRRDLREAYEKATDSIESEHYPAKRVELKSAQGARCTTPHAMRAPAFPAGCDI